MISEPYIEDWITMEQRGDSMDDKYPDWNRWTGGLDGLFFNPECWSWNRVPVNGDSFYIDNGRIELPGHIAFGTIVVDGQVILANEPNVTVATVDTMIITRKARDAGCTIGKQGKTLT